VNATLAVIAKVLVTALLIVGASELAKRSNFVSALLVALPLTSALTVIWLYLETRDAGRAGQYAASVLLLLPPGCLFLAVLPLAIRAGGCFWPSFAAAEAVTLATYYAYAAVLQRFFGVSL
jgi:cobalamin synthase